MVNDKADYLAHGSIAEKRWCSIQIWAQFHHPQPNRGQKLNSEICLFFQILL